MNDLAFFSSIKGVLGTERVTKHKDDLAPIHDILNYVLNWKQLKIASHILHSDSKWFLQGACNES